MSCIIVKSTHICPCINNASPSQISQEGHFNLVIHGLRLDKPLHVVVAFLHHLRAQQGKTCQREESNLKNAFGKVECKLKMAVCVLWFACVPTSIMRTCTCVSFLIPVDSDVHTEVMKTIFSQMQQNKHIWSFMRADSTNLMH